MTNKIPTPQPNVHDYVTLMPGSRLLIGTPIDPSDEDTRHLDVEVVLTKKQTVCLSSGISPADFVVIGINPEDGIDPDEC